MSGGCRSSTGCAIRARFPPRVGGELLEDGARRSLMADKPGVSAPAPSERMRAPAAAGRVQAKRVKGWTIYRRDEERTAAAKRAIQERV